VRLEGLYDDGDIPGEENGKVISYFSSPRKGSNIDIVNNSNVSSSSNSIDVAMHDTVVQQYESYSSNSVPVRDEDVCDDNAYEDDDFDEYDDDFEDS
jgi:hypothetical protein